MLAQFSMIAVLAAAGAAAQNFTVAGYFNISSVSGNDLASWCTSQKSVCSTLCAGSTKTNICAGTDIAHYSCLCASNSSVPGLQYYLNTVPTFECQNAYGQCINDHPNDLTGQNQCATDINATCGTIDSTKVSITSSSSSSAVASATSASSASGTASATATSASATASSTGTTKSDASALFISTGQQYGLGALAAGAIAAFGYML